MNSTSFSRLNSILLIIRLRNSFLVVASISSSFIAINASDNKSNFSSNSIFSGSLFVMSSSSQESNNFAFFFSILRISLVRSSICCSIPCETTLWDCEQFSEMYLFYVDCTDECIEKFKFIIDKKHPGLYEIKRIES